MPSLSISTQLPSFGVQRFSPRRETRMTASGSHSRTLQLECSVKPSGSSLVLGKSRKIPNSRRQIKVKADRLTMTKAWL